MLGGRKKKAIELLAEGKLSRRSIAKRVGVHPSTLSRWLKEPPFLAAFYEEVSLAQCQDLQTIHRLVQGAYREFLKRLSKEEISEVSTQHLVQLMDRLHRQFKEMMEQLKNLRGTQDAAGESEGLLSEEEYRELAEEILKKIRERPAGSQEPRSA